MHRRNSISSDRYFTGPLWKTCQFRTEGIANISHPAYINLLFQCDMTVQDNTHYIESGSGGFTSGSVPCHFALTDGPRIVTQTDYYSTGAVCGEIDLLTNKQHAIVFTCQTSAQVCLNNYPHTVSYFRVARAPKSLYYKCMYSVGWSARKPLWVSQDRG